MSSLVTDSIFAARTAHVYVHVFLMQLSLRAIVLWTVLQKSSIQPGDNRGLALIFVS